MPKDDQGASLNHNLTFFKTKLTHLNTQRLGYNRNRNCVKYFVDPQQYSKTLAPVAPVFGVISFSLYAIRFAINVRLLIQEQSEKIPNPIYIKELYYNLFNDLLWGTCNLTQFFWWTFAVSSSAGFKGLQLEAFAQLVDLLTLIIRYREAYQNHHTLLNTITDVDEQNRLRIEWHYKTLHFIRSCLTAALILSAFSVLAFSVTSAPISPIIFLISLCGTIARIGINVDSDLKSTTPSVQLNRARKEEINQMTIDYVLLPVGLYIIITAPIPLALVCVLGLILLQQAFAAWNLDSTVIPNTVRDLLESGSVPASGDPSRCLPISLKF